MNISEIAHVIGACTCDCTIEINWLLTDSRSLSFPENTLFFSLHTERNNGNKYIPELYRRGVRCFVVQQMIDTRNELPDAIFLEVPDTLCALQQVAAAHRCQFHVPVVGVTGSNGKTIVKEWLYQLMRHDLQIARSPRSYNSQIGVPLSVWQMNKNTQLAIFEAGISECGEMQHLQEIIQPTIGIFTNVADAHQENFSDVNEKCVEKMRLFSDVDVLIYNVDCELIHRIARSEGLNVFTWGRNQSATVQIMDVERKNQSTIVTYGYKNESYSYEIKFTDQASIENSIQCLCCMLHLAYQPADIAQRMCKLESVEMRLEMKQGVNNCLIINDSYNSDLASLTIALDFLDKQHDEQQREKTVILSDILQNGQDKAQLYAAVATLFKNRNISKFIGIGEQISEFQHEFIGINATFYLTTDEYLNQRAYCDLHDQRILIKGSRQFKFEQITHKLEAIVNQTVMEVNLSALVNNVNYFRNKLKPTTKLMSMVKASAYGVGVIDVAHTLQHNGCDYLAVAVADEGVALRKGGIILPIVIMDPHPNAFNAMFQYNLEPSIYSFKILREFIQIADQNGIIHYPIHLKIDSGMHRLGFGDNDLSELCAELRAQQAVRVCSVFSHLASADSPSDDAFTMQQIHFFENCVAHIDSGLQYKFMRHILNSAGIERFPQYQFDMVRLGIGHYNISAVEKHSMQNVCAFKTVILQIKTICKGESIGYGRETLLVEEKRIGIIPVGYADGLDRRLGNGVGEVIKNRWHPSRET